MKIARWSMSLVICVAIAFAAAELLASAPVAVYAIVDEVVIEPNEAKPERVRIRGAFSVVEGYGSKYSAARRGYLYYSIEPTDSTQKAARLILADLQRMAGTGEAIAFGGGWWDSAGGRVRNMKDKANKPDRFPSGNPVTRLASSRAEVIAQLKAAPEAR
jgi:hypothetical protein